MVNLSVRKDRPLGKFLVFLFLLVSGAATAQPIPGSGLLVRQGPAATAQGEQSAALFIGLNAGAAFPLGTPDTYGVTAIGSGALQSLTATGTENTALGSWACQYVTTGTQATCLGMHALGYDPTPVGDVALGNDARRDSVSTGGYTVSVGQHAMAHGYVGVGNVAIGTQAMIGDSTAVILGGSLTNGNTLTVTIAASVSSPGNLTGLPLTRTHVVAGGDTLATIAAAICTQVGTVINGPSYFVGCVSGQVSDGTAFISLQYPGDSTVGWALTTTAAWTGSGVTETATVTGGATESASVAIGGTACESFVMAAAVWNNCEGYGTGNNLTYGSYNVMNGGLSGYSLTSGSYNLVGGYRAGYAMTTAYANVIQGHISGANLTIGFGNTILGSVSGGALTTAQENTFIGFGVATTTCATGYGLILIGSGSDARNVDCPAAGTSQWLNIENSIYHNTVAPTISSGFGSVPSVPHGNSDAAFTVNVGTGGTASSGVITFATAAPNGWACFANDNTNNATFVEGVVSTSASSITITNYSRTTGLPIAWTASDVLVVSCSGF
jgi:hypothetical protein